MGGGLKYLYKGKIRHKKKLLRHQQVRIKLKSVNVQKFKGKAKRIFKLVEEEERPVIVTYPSDFAAIVQPLTEERVREPNVVNVQEFKGKAKRFFKLVEEEERSVMVTYPSDFAAIVQPLREERARELAKESARDLIAARTKSEQELAIGSTTLASDLAKELGINVSGGHAA